MNTNHHVEGLQRLLFGPAENAFAFVFYEGRGGLLTFPELDLSDVVFGFFISGGGA